jgi:hypothetical protein
MLGNVVLAVRCCCLILPYNLLLAPLNSFLNYTDLIHAQVKLTFEFFFLR